jgi:hypothetical protein
MEIMQTTLKVDTWNGNATEAPLGSGNLPLPASSRRMEAPTKNQ